MKAPPFAYVRAASLADVFRLWARRAPRPSCWPAGRRCWPTLAFRLSDPGTLIDISRVPELKGIAQAGDAMRVGALTTHAELGASELIRRHVPLLAQAVPLIAHPAIRNRGTIGGSLAFADPAAELPACCVALEATIIARTAAGERRIPAAQFFTGLYTTALAANELIAAIEFPVAKAGRALRHPGAGAALRRLRHGRHGGAGRSSPAARWWSRAWSSSASATGRSLPSGPRPPSPARS